MFKTLTNLKLRRYKKYLPSRRKHPVIARVGWAALALLMFGTLLMEATSVKEGTDSYVLSSEASSLVGAKSTTMAQSLKLDQKSQAFLFNDGYKPGGEVAGQVSGPKFSASMPLDPDKGTVITDPSLNLSVTFKPLFNVRTPQQDGNRLIYPLGGGAQKVYSLKAIGVKEDIILQKSIGDSVSYAYKLELPSGTEARLESNGSLAIYGVTTALLGNVSTSNEKDAELLQQARNNGKKDTLLFTFPAPFVKEYGKTMSSAKSWYTYEDGVLTVHASGLEKASYPLTIDPTVYLETAAKLMRGNNESNIDFDVSNQLIQKSQTTGARIDAWQNNLDTTTATWDHATTAAGGFIYRSGGRTGPSRPTVASSQQTLDNTDGTSFVMNMPSTRPAGDLYIALMCHDGSNGSNVSAPSGWIERADLQGFAAYYRIGTDQGGGNEAASYTFTGPNERWAGIILRITNYDTTTPLNTWNTTSDTSNSATPTYPSVTPTADMTLIIGAAGFDQDAPSSTGWVPSGWTKLGSANSNGTSNSNACGYTAASRNTSPFSGVASGAVTHADASVADDYGSITISVNPVAGTTNTQTALDWASFNSSTLAIESPNPGNGVCASWCTNSAYDLPVARRGHTMVSYNGYLYVMGGLDGSGTRTSTVYIAKLGANGEPQLWHPSNGTKVYWYQDTGLNGATAKSYFAAAAYNNRMYVVGGQTNAATTGVTTVEYADIRPDGTLGTWTAGTSLPAGAGRFMHTIQIYNDTIYTVGGFEGAATSTANMRSAVYYNKINTDGSLNSWVSTTSFNTPRVTMGGTFSTIWAGYIYLGGGCSAVNASGYCTTFATDMQLASINADGTIAEWNTMIGLTNSRIGQTFLSWQGGLYRIGGCEVQSTTTGECTQAIADVDYGVINSDGDASTVATSVNTSTAPCSTTNTNCNLPGTGNIGNLLTSAAIVNGYLYIIGGCTDEDCNAASGNTAYALINNDGTITRPSSCPGGTAVASYCVDSTGPITNGVAAAGTAVFNDRIYVYGGVTGSAQKNAVNYVDVAAAGNIGTWQTQTISGGGGLGMTSVSYPFVYARANPSSAGSNPGNFYVFGGCTVGTAIGCSGYTGTVYKCNIGTSGALNGCTTTGQEQIGTISGASGAGLAAHAGTVYANYIYLIGGLAPNLADLNTVRYAKFDDNNNVVTVTTSGWLQSSVLMNNGRRRGAGFGYNGYIYIVGGYDATVGVLADIEFAQINVSDGSLRGTGDGGVNLFDQSSVSVNQRWGLTVPVSNSYAFVIGGCTDGQSPTCNPGGPTDTVQTFQLYNNDSGALRAVTAGTTLGADRIGGSATVMNGYIYYAGGCTDISCTTLTKTTFYATIDSYGTIGTWSAGGTMPGGGGIAWGKLLNAGGTLYYLGGQSSSSTATATGAGYYSSAITSGNPTWTALTRGIGNSGSGNQARTQFGAAAWSNTLFVTGGFNASGTAQSTVYVSPVMTNGGDITGNWTSTTAFDVARAGHTTVAYANNLYVLGGYDGTNYLNDTQYTQININSGTNLPDGTVDAWTFSTSLPNAIRDADGFAANGYIYLVGGRTAATTCVPIIQVAPISANTTVATGNNPTGFGEWYETSVKYTGDRYGAAAAYGNGRLVVIGGGCSAMVSSGDRMYYSTLKSQPQIAKYSRMIDTDVDVFPKKWLMNGLDNSVGAEWRLRYRSMTDNDGDPTDCVTAMTTWGTETNFGRVTLGQPEDYIARDGSNVNTTCARYFYFSVNIDSSQAFGYPDDVSRGPTIDDLSLFYTADPSKRLIHGKTFTGGEQQPLDTPFY